MKTSRASRCPACGAHAPRAPAAQVVGAVLEPGCLYPGGLRAPSVQSAAAGRHDERHGVQKEKPRIKSWARHRGLTFARADTAWVAARAGRCQGRGGRVSWAEG